MWEQWDFKHFDGIYYKWIQKKSNSTFYYYCFMNSQIDRIGTQSSMGPVVSVVILVLKMDSIKYKYIKAINVTPL